MQLQQFINLSHNPVYVVIFIVFLVWSLVWKALALWRAAINRQIAWFVVMLLVNSLGLLEILYIFCFAKPKSRDMKK